MSNYETSTTDIRASRLIGRVGGLAVALGVGAVWFSGGIASADTGSDSGSGTGRASHARSADNDSPRSAATSRSARPERTAPRAAASTVTTQRNSGSTVGKPAAAAPAAEAIEVAEAAPVVDVPAETSRPAPVSVVADSPAPVAEITAPVVDAAPVALPEAAPVSAEMTAFATAGADGVDPSADGSPTLPADNPLEWAVAAFARRTVLAAAAEDPTYNVGACTQQSTSCTYIMGPSGVPIPSSAYAATVMKYYVLPNSTQPDITSQLVYTPEGAYPATGIKVLPLTISAQQGQTILQNTIETLQPGPETGDMPVNIFGYSQSAVISSLFQRTLDDAPLGFLPGLDRSQLTFVTVGQEMAPDGGWFARFPGLNLPSLGEYFFGSTPENSYPVTNYTLEYDGFADAPKYPGNFLSALNASMGILFVHVNYANEKYFANTYGTTLGSFDPVMGLEGPGVACNEGSSSCIQLPTTAEDQKYYFIKTPHLPLLVPVRAIPLIGKPIAALIEPVLKVIVDLGYGDQAHGFKTAPQPYANVPNPFGLFPQVSPIEVATKLIAGVQQGVKDFFGSFGSGGGGGGISLPTLKELVAISKEIVSTLPARISAGLSALYGTLLATADIVNAALISLPTYDLQLAIDSLKDAIAPGGAGLIEGVINAIGLPWAADVGLFSTIAVIQTAVWLSGILGALTGCGPSAPTTGLCLVPSLA